MHRILLLFINNVIICIEILSASRWLGGARVKDTDNPFIGHSPLKWEEGDTGGRAGEVSKRKSVRQEIKSR